MGISGSAAGGGRPPARRVPLRDLGAEHASLRGEMDAAVARVLDSGHSSAAPNSTPSSASWPRRSAAATPSACRPAPMRPGRLMALDVGPRRRRHHAVHVLRHGRRDRASRRAPVFADIDPASFNLDLMRRRRGHSAHAPGPQSTCSAASPGCRIPSVPILEDAAQSIRTGAPRGAAACLSFFPSKNLCDACDGRCSATSHSTSRARAACSAPTGSSQVPPTWRCGNFRLDAIQAALLRVKLPRLGAWTHARRASADRYRRSSPPPIWPAT